MDFPEKALNAYLFNVEYGYAPSGVTECKRIPRFQFSQERSVLDRERE